MFAKWREVQDRQAAERADDGATPQVLVQRSTPPASTATASAPPKAAPPGPRRPKRPLLPASDGRVRDTCDGLARMLSSGIGIVETLRALSASTSGLMARALADMSTCLANGSTLAEAMSRHPGVFQDSDVHGVAMGERVGDVAPALLQIAKRREARRVARAALGRTAAYPLFVLVVCIFVGPLPMVFASTTSAYIATVTGSAMGLLALLFVVLIGVPWLLRYTTLGPRLRRLMWFLPWPATIYVTFVRARFNATFARCLDAGLSLYESLRTSAAVTGDPEANRQITHVVAAIQGGAELATPLGQTRLVTPSDQLQILAGERSGTLAESLETVARGHEEIGRRKAEVFLKILGNVITIGIFVYVAMTVLGSYQSLSQETQQVFDLIEQEMPYTYEKP